MQTIQVFYQWSDTLVRLFYTFACIQIIFDATELSQISYAENL